MREVYRLSPASPVIVGVLAAAHIGLPLDANATADAIHYVELARDLGLPKEEGPMPAVRSYAAGRLGRHDEAADAGRDVAGQMSIELQEAGAGRVIELVYARWRIVNTRQWRWKDSTDCWRRRDRNTLDYWAVHGAPDGCELKEGRLVVG